VGLYRTFCRDLSFQRRITRLYPLPLRQHLLWSISYLSEILGICSLQGCLWPWIRRYVTKLTAWQQAPGSLDTGPAVLPLSWPDFCWRGAPGGQYAEWEAYSFVGVIFSSLISSKNRQRPFTRLFGFHILVSLLLIAYFPFSKLFHSLAAPVNICLAPQPQPVMTGDDKTSEGLEFPSGTWLISPPAQGAEVQWGVPISLCHGAVLPREFIAQAKEYTSVKFNP